MTDEVIAAEGPGDPGSQAAARRASAASIPSPPPSLPPSSRRSTRTKPSTRSANVSNNCRKNGSRNSGRQKCLALAGTRQDREGTRGHGRAASDPQGRLAKIGRVDRAAKARASDRSADAGWHNSDSAPPTANRESIDRRVGGPSVHERQAPGGQASRMPQHHVPWDVSCLSRSGFKTRKMSPTAGRFVVKNQL